MIIFLKTEKEASVLKKKKKKRHQKTSDQRQKRGLYSMCWASIRAVFGLPHDLENTGNKKNA